MKKRKIVLSIMITVCTMFCLCGCSQKEPSVVRTYEKTDSKEAFENTEPVIMVKHYEMSDGTWKTDDYTYQYRLEITGRMNNAEKDSTFIFLSNIENIIRHGRQPDSVVIWTTISMWRLQNLLA